MSPIEPLGMAAIRKRRLGEIVVFDQLIAAAVAAVAAGVPGAALARLAGLGRRDEAGAHDLPGQDGVGRGMIESGRHGHGRRKVAVKWHSRRSTGPCSRMTRPGRGRRS
jgi:hypothetical protein